MSAFVLQPRCRAVLLAGTKVRVFTSRQLARLFWTGTASGLRAMQRRMARLEDEGFYRSDLRILQQVELHGPLAVIDADTNPADIATLAGAIAYQAQKRSMHTRATATRVYSVTARGAGLFGRTAPASRPHQLTHDVGVAEVLCHLALNRPEAAARFEGEDEVRRRNVWAVTPDALVTDENDRPLHGIEYVSSSYDRRRVLRDLAWGLRRVHDGELVTYQVW